MKNQKFWNDAKEKCRARKALKNDVLDAKIGVDTTANDRRRGSESLKNREKKVDQSTADRTVGCSYDSLIASQDALPALEFGTSARLLD